MGPFRPVAALALVTLLTVVSACSGSSSDQKAATTSTSTTALATTTTLPGIDPDAWAETFCGNYRRWLAAVRLAATGVDGDVTEGDVASGRDAIVKLFETSSVETETLIGQIDDGDVPRIQNGERLVADLSNRFTEFNTAIADAKADAESLPTDDPAAFKTKVAELTETFQAEINTVARSFDELDASYPSPELQRALAGSCAAP